MNPGGKGTMVHDQLHEPTESFTLQDLYLQPVNF